MLFLIETMVNEKNTLSILPSNHSGGLAVLWNNAIIPVSVLFTEP